MVWLYLAYPSGEEGVIYLFQIISTCLLGCQRKREGSQHPVGPSLFNLMSKAKEIAAEFLYRREMNNGCTLN
jgi:hypothetical protein